MRVIESHVAVDWVVLLTKSIVYRVVRPPMVAILLDDGTMVAVFPTGDVNPFRLAHVAMGDGQVRWKSPVSTS